MWLLQLHNSSDRNIYHSSSKVSITNLLININKVFQHQRLSAAEYPNCLCWRIAEVNQRESLWLNIKKQKSQFCHNSALRPAKEHRHKIRFWLCFDSNENSKGVTPFKLRSLLNNWKSQDKEAELGDLFFPFFSTLTSMNYG